MLKFILWAFVLYFIYKLIVDLIWPVSKTVRSMKKTVQQMQEQQRVYEQQYSNPAYTTQAKESSKPQAGTTNTNTEYIDFEEVK
jgi:Sec-independent protein translocase protein TatA